MTESRLAREVVYTATSGDASEARLAREVAYAAASGDASEARHAREAVYAAISGDTSESRLARIAVYVAVPDASARVAATNLSAALQEASDSRVAATNLLTALQEASDSRMAATHLLVALLVEGIAGSSAGAATVTGTLAPIVNEVDGTPIGESSVTADLTTEPGTLALVSGKTTISVTLQLTHNLSGSPAGSATVAGDILFFGAAPAGVSTVTGSLEITRHLAGSSSGSATASGFMALTLVEGVAAGTSTVTGYLRPPSISAFEIPYNLSLGGTAITNLVASPFAIRCYGTVAAELFVSTSTSSTGTSTVSATLYEGQVSGGTSAGSTSISASLWVNPTGTTVELSGTITGTSSMSTGWLLIMDFTPFAWDSPRYLYMYKQVGVGFDPTDDDSGSTGFVSQSYPDGNVYSDWTERYLYMYKNIGVGFDPTDDASSDPGFVSQSYPDGDTVNDWARYFYQYVNIWDPGFRCAKSLVFYPGWSPQKKPVPKPPRGS